MHIRKIVIALLVLFTSSVYAHQHFEKVEIQTIPVSQNVFMLMGAGGNLGVSTGNDGVFLIDDQYAPLTDKIVAAISKLSDKPIKFLINTHWHFDHTGGNENIGKGDTVIVAHENVRKRMAKGQFMKAFNFQVPAASAHALPVVTFPTSLTFHFNDETIEVVHFPGSHTDGDAVIYFKKTNVVHTGDLFFNGIYPFIDSESGGSIKGMIDSVSKILDRIDDNTKVIPGHGPLASKKDFEGYREMLATVYKSLAGMLAKGMSIEKIVEAKPTAEFDEKWGKGFLTPDQFVQVVCAGIK